MGAIKKDAKTGKWDINRLVKRPDGTYAHLHRRGYSNPKAAEADLLRLVKKISEGPTSSSPKKSEKTLSFLASAYLAEKETKVRLSTFEATKGLIGSDILPHIGGRKASAAFQKESLSVFRSAVSKMPVSAERKSRIMGVMREIAGFGFAKDLVTADGYRNAQSILQPFGDDSSDVRAEKRALTPEEYKKFIATFADGDRYKILFEVFFYLGCRCGELQGLQWRDYDPAAGDIFIHQQNQYIPSRHSWVVSQTKTKASVRHIKLSPFIGSELEALREGYGQRSDYFLFFGPKAITKHPIVEQLRRHCAMAGIPMISPHEIRHTAASWLVAGCRDMSDLILVQRWLGHSSLKETLDTYSHYLKSGPGIESVMAGIQGGK